MAEPVFPKRDPADPGFWDLRYQAQVTPWELGAVPAELRALVAGSGKPRRVLVPGCGSAWDVRFLAESGWDVTGIDFSAAAVAVAQGVLGPHAARVSLADFFAPLPGEPFEMVYERAFLCALPRRLWSDWARRVAQLLPPGGVLAGFFFIGEGERGPPFPLHGQAELDALLAPNFTQLEDRPAVQSLEVFRGRERWQSWKRK